ncbi:hypothetical protein OWV82_024376 [Melia azedarach]|uniref:Uncharacterized protein n=1 Tax=Melia azedarach TaxID=155640 RepID=A0ACC1WQF5_MELAZ|nr:hypothetical protein OWV82_024376 [Melia azedarach]
MAKKSKLERMAQLRHGISHQRHTHAPFLFWPRGWRGSATEVRGRATHSIPWRSNAPWTCLDDFWSGRISEELRERSEVIQVRALERGLERGSLKLGSLV